MYSNRILTELFTNHSRNVLYSISTVFCSIFIVFLLIQGRHHPKLICDLFESCDTLEAKIESSRKIAFCLEEASSRLDKLVVYNSQECESSTKFNVSVSYRFYKDLKHFFTNELQLRLILKSNDDFYCPYIVRGNILKFCFNDSKHLTLFHFPENITMNPQEAYHLLIYLKVFFR